MKDKLTLLVIGVVVAVLAWAFWHFLEQDAFFVLSALMLVVLSVDNRRLRKKLTKV